MAVRLTVCRPDGKELTELTFDQQRVRIGRSKGCDLRIPHRSVSLEHAMVLLEGGRYYLVDLGSTNGTTLGDEVLVFQRRKLLRSGDSFGISAFLVVFHAGVPMASHHSQDRTFATAHLLAYQILASDQQSFVRPALVVANGPQVDRRFELKEPPATLIAGRAGECDLVLVDSEVSRRHFELRVTLEGVIARDLESKNPLKINGRPTSQQRLHDRDELLVGSTTLIFDDPVEAYVQMLAKLPEDRTDRPSAENPAFGEIDQSESRPGRENHEISPDQPPQREPKGPGYRTGSEIKAPAGSERPLETRSATSPGRRRSDLAPTERNAPADAPWPPAPPGEREGEEIATRAPRNESTFTPWISTGGQIAILLVGVLALVICIVGLVWIFR